MGLDATNRNKAARKRSLRDRREWTPLALPPAALENQDGSATSLARRALARSAAPCWPPQARAERRARSGASGAGMTLPAEESGKGPQLPGLQAPRGQVGGAAAAVGAFVYGTGRRADERGPGGRSPEGWDSGSNHLSHPGSGCPSLSDLGSDCKVRGSRCQRAGRPQALDAQTPGDPRGPPDRRAI